MPQPRSRHGRPATKRRRPRFSRAILLGVVVVLAGSGFFLLRETPSGRSGPPPASVVPKARDRTGGESPAPSYYSDVESGDAFRPIADRSSDPDPLTVEEIFAGSARSPSYRGVRLALRETRLDSECAAAVWGEGLEQDLERNGCSQVLRGVYVDTDSRVLGLVAIFNMKDVEGATAVISTLDPQHNAGFVLPLPGDAGRGGRLGRGYSEAYAHAMGHFVFVRWAQEISDPTPSSRSSSEISKANVALTDVQWGIRQRALVVG